MSTPAARYLALADTGNSAGWRYVLGLIVMVACWLIGGGFAYVLVLQLELFGAVAEFVAINASILMLLVGVVAVVTVLHCRGWRTLVTPRASLDWKRAATGAGVWIALMMGFAVVEHLLYPGRYTWSLDVPRWLPFVAAALLLTPLQCAAEELAFRGYLLQALSRVSRRPWLIAAASSVLFTLPHLFNPEIEAYGRAIMAANYFVMGLFLASIVLRDGGLELAIGAHTGNNLLLALGINYEDSVFGTASMFTAGRLDPVYSLVTLALSALLFHGCLFRKARHAPPIPV